MEKILNNIISKKIALNPMRPIGIITKSDPEGAPFFAVTKLHIKALLVDKIFTKEIVDEIGKVLNQALKASEISGENLFGNGDADFVYKRFKSLCTMLNHGLTVKENEADFATYLKRIITENFLPEKINEVLNNIIDDYQRIVENIEGFALWDAYNIYAKENSLKTIEAPMSYKQAATLAYDQEETYSTIDDIVKFCHKHPIYQNHSYLDDEASAPEIAILMHKYPPCADLVEELNVRYKNIISTMQDIIDSYELIGQTSEDI